MKRFYSFKECSCYSYYLFKSMSQVFKAENLLAAMAGKSAETWVSRSACSGFSPVLSPVEMSPQWPGTSGLLTRAGKNLRMHRGENESTFCFVLFFLRQRKVGQDTSTATTRGERSKSMCPGGWGPTCNGHPVSQFMGF